MIYSQHAHEIKYREWTEDIPNDWLYLKIVPIQRCRKTSINGSLSTLKIRSSGFWAKMAAQEGPELTPSQDTSNWHLRRAVPLKKWGLTEKLLLNKREREHIKTGRRNAMQYPENPSPKHRPAAGRGHRGACPGPRGKTALKVTETTQEGKPCHSPRVSDKWRGNCGLSRVRGTGGRHLWPPAPHNYTGRSKMTQTHRPAH